MWEYPSDASQGLDFLSLLATTRAYLPEDEYVLAAALPANKEILQHVDLRLAAEHLDLLNLMTYDFYGPWAPRSGHHAQLYSTTKDEPSAATMVQYVMGRGFPAKRILLGIPAYGRSFLHASGPGQKFRGGGGEDGTFGYQQLPRRGCKEVVDKRACAAMCVGGDGGFVSYDNPETVKMKAAFCKQKGLGVSTCRLPAVGGVGRFGLADTGKGAVLLDWADGRCWRQVAEPCRGGIQGVAFVVGREGVLLHESELLGSFPWPRPVETWFSSKPLPLFPILEDAQL